MTITLSAPLGYRPRWYRPAPGPHDNPREFKFRLWKRINDEKLHLGEGRYEVALMHPVNYGYPDLSTIIPIDSLRMRKGGKVDGVRFGPGSLDQPLSSLHMEIGFR